MNSAFPRLQEELAVAPQLTPEQLPALAAEGFRTLICNRPDDEEPGQPSAAAMAAAAAQHGLAFCNLPITSATLSDADIDAFGQALADLPRPILAYCRSGNRCTVLWALARAGERPLPELQQAAAAAGYDLGPWLDRMASRAAAR